jgi:hypothetical protein
MFLSMRHHNFVFWSTGHRAVSTGQIYFEFFCLLDTVQCLIDQVMNLQYSVDKNMLNNVFYTKP